MKHEHRVEMISAENCDFSEEEKKQFEKHLQNAVVETLYRKGLLTHVQRELCLEKLGFDFVIGSYP